MLRRLKLLGASHAELVECFIKQARSVLEYCAVVWHASLSQINSADIEIVQKTVCATILGAQYTSYQSALAHLVLDRLDSRRNALSIKFVKKAFKSAKYSSWFMEDSNPLNTRREVKTVKEAQCRTSRLKESALPYPTHILNTDQKTDTIHS